MCGIILALNKNRNKINSIKHRGIQYSAIEEDGYIFGHHRLPIQTLEHDKWNQPIQLSDGTLLLYNGEIFNYNKQKYDNDVEYLKDFFNQNLPYAFIVEEVNKWDGFWSIVLIKKDDIICFTDPLGKKQLYYNQLGEISSEVKELSQTNKIDNIFISTVNKWGYNTDNRTLYEDVKRIMPNNIYIFKRSLKKGNIFAFHSFYNIISNYFDWNVNIPNKSIYELLEESVRSRLISKKYKVSTLFSAGLDSTTILYFLKKFNADVNIYSISNEEDREYVKFMEKEWNLNINYLNTQEEDVPFDQKMKIYDINDSMIDLGSVIPQYYLFKDIKDKIVLTGDGADELFGGYRRIDEYDSQKSDVFEELPFYHLIRIDRMSMYFTIECRNPFLSHNLVKKALTLPFEERKHKKILKDTFKGLIPDEIINRKKNPLKIKSIREDEKNYRNNLIKDYLKYKQNKLNN